MKQTKTKENADIFVDCLCDNDMFKSSMFPNSLKLADVTPLDKKGRKELKEDNRSVSILPTLSKMFAQISAFFEYVFSKYQCGFWKGYSTQHCKLKILQKWKKCIGKGNFINRPLKGI